MVDISDLKSRLAKTREAEEKERAEREERRQKEAALKVEATDQWRGLLKRIPKVIDQINEELGDDRYRLFFQASNPEPGSSWVGQGVIARANSGRSGMRLRALSDGQLMTEFSIKERNFPKNFELANVTDEDIKIFILEYLDNVIPK